MMSAIAFLLGLLIGYLLGYQHRTRLLDQRIAEIQQGQEELRRELQAMRSRLFDADE